MTLKWYAQVYKRVCWNQKFLSFHAELYYICLVFICLHQPGPEPLCDPCLLIEFQVFIWEILVCLDIGSVMKGTCTVLCPLCLQFHGAPCHLQVQDDWYCFASVESLLNLWWDICMCLFAVSGVSHHPLPASGKRAGRRHSQRWPVGVLFSSGAQCAQNVGEWGHHRHKHSVHRCIL